MDSLAPSMNSAQLAPSLFLSSLLRAAWSPASVLLPPSPNRSVPQVPSRSVDFTTFRWDALLKRLKQMMMTGNAVEEGLNWCVQGARAVCWF